MRNPVCPYRYTDGWIDRWMETPRSPQNGVVVKLPDPDAPAEEAPKARHTLVSLVYLLVCTLNPKNRSCNVELPGCFADLDGRV